MWLLIILLYSQLYIYLINESEEIRYLLIYTVLFGREASYSNDESEWQ